MISDNTVTNQNEENIAKIRTNYIFRINEKEMQSMSWSASPKTAFGRRVGSVIGFNVIIDFYDSKF